MRRQRQKHSHGNKFMQLLLQLQPLEVTVSLQQPYSLIYLTERENKMIDLSKIYTLTYLNCFEFSVLKLALKTQFSSPK